MTNGFEKKKPFLMLSLILKAFEEDTQLKYVIWEKVNF